MWLVDGKPNVLCSSTLFYHYILIKSMVPVWVTSKAVTFFRTVSPWKQFLEHLRIYVPWVCYSCVKERPHYKSGFLFDPETCTMFYLFTCPIPAVCSQLAQPIRAQLKPQSVLQTLIQLLQTRLQISQGKERWHSRQVRCNFNRKLKVLSQLVSN